MDMSFTSAETMICENIFYEISNDRIYHHLCSMTLLLLSDWLYQGCSV